MRKARTRIEEPERQPLPAKGVILVLEKAADAARDDFDAGGQASEVERIRAMPPGPAKARAILDYAAVPGRRR